MTGGTKIVPFATTLGIEILFTTRWFTLFDSDTFHAYVRCRVVNLDGGMCNAGSSGILSSRALSLSLALIMSVKEVDWQEVGGAIGCKLNLEEKELKHACFRVSARIQ
jgi:hypothetical protein